MSIILEILVIILKKNKTKQNKAKKKSDLPHVFCFYLPSFIAALLYDTQDC